MRFKVFKPKEDEKAEEPLYLSLVQGGDKVIVEATDAHGKHRAAGNLLIFNGDGTVSRCYAVSSRLGFKLDEAGRIELSDTGD